MRRQSGRDFRTPLLPLLALQYERVVFQDGVPRIAGLKY